MKCKDCGNTHPALPGFPNHVLCDYYHLHMSNSADASRCEHFKANVLSNADRIRASTDEELAEFFGTLPCCPPGTDVNELYYPSDSCNGTDLQVRCWLEWLKQEAT